jgi:SAM-dependent methyltransferase
VKINDPVDVREQYATEANLAARRALYEGADGPDPRQLALDAVAEGRPARVLEVGGGPGELSARMARELGVDVVMIDVSPRMVELARSRGVDARVGDIQSLEFADASFDCVVAAWVLFHLPDLDAGIAELARVLRPGGRLVAATNAEDHMLELRRLAGAAAWARIFTRENGAEILGRHFAVVERRDADGVVSIESEELVHGWFESLGDPHAVLAPFTVPMSVRRESSGVVATQ